MLDFVNGSVRSASACTVSFNERNDSNATILRSSKPAAATVICNGRDSPRFPLRSTATNFVTSKSPGLAFCS